MRITNVGCVLALVAGGGFAIAQEAKSLRAGLVATYLDSAALKKIGITRLEGGIKVAVKKGEAPHPRLAADGGVYRWDGFIKVTRAGEYQFSAALLGKLRMMVAGKEAIVAESKTAAVVHGNKLRLDAGMHSLIAEFTRPAGDARLRVEWESSLFRREPLPYDVLFHAPAEAAARLQLDERSEHGRFLVEERNCTQCHRPGDGEKIADGLRQRLGPDLSSVGARTAAGWIYRWLSSPRAIYPAATMPEMFSGDDAGRTDIYAVSRYLASLGGPFKFEKGDKDPDRVKRGQLLFATVGCSACHTATKDNSTAIFPLAGLGRKTSPKSLAAYLRDPLAIDPSGRMPGLLLHANEAADLAHYLCGQDEPEMRLPAVPPKELLAAAFKRVDPRPDELKEFLKLPADQQWLDLGKRIVIDRGCNNCHTIAPEGQPFANVLADAAFEDLRDARRIKNGCLSADKTKRGKSPWFGWTDGDADAVRHFLREGSTGAHSPAPMHQARVALQRFHCLACHVRNGHGGLPKETIDLLQKHAKADHAEAVSPPSLTGVAGKLRTPWLRQVLVDAGRARPWFAMRMPQFGKENVGTLAEALAAVEGMTADDAIHKVAATPALLEAGRLLIGKTAFNCVACHDMSGRPGTGARGPDLASMTQRVRYDWYRRWLEQPERMQPGTRMPTVFANGRSLLKTVLDGDAAKQADAMWGYLLQGPKLKLPD
jgi:mono/diheme cytochrome c family protein